MHTCIPICIHTYIHTHIVTIIIILIITYHAAYWCYWCYWTPRQGGSPHPCVMPWVPGLPKVATASRRTQRTGDTGCPGFGGKWQLQSVSSITNGDERGRALVRLTAMVRLTARGKVARQSNAAAEQQASKRPLGSTAGIQHQRGKLLAQHKRNHVARHLAGHIKAHQGTKESTERSTWQGTERRQVAEQSFVPSHVLCRSAPGCQASPPPLGFPAGYTVQCNAGQCSVVKCSALHGARGGQCMAYIHTYVHPQIFIRHMLCSIPTRVLGHWVGFGWQ